MMKYAGKDTKISLLTKEQALHIHKKAAVQRPCNPFVPVYE